MGESQESPSDQQNDRLDSLQKTIVRHVARRMVMNLAAQRRLQSTPPEGSTRFFVVCASGSIPAPPQSAALRSWPSRRTSKARAPPLVLARSISIAAVMVG